MDGGPGREPVGQVHKMGAAARATERVERRMEECRDGSRERDLLVECEPPGTDRAVPGSNAACAGGGNDAGVREEPLVGPPDAGGSAGRGGCAPATD